VSVSKDLTNAFRSSMEQMHNDMDISFRVMVLGANAWPLNPPGHEFVIPAEIVPTYVQFQQYYEIKHINRRLTWLWNYSENELRTNYTNQKYILVTSTYQMAVLVQYNKSDTLSVEELAAATGVPRKLLVQVLGLLVKAKILINEVSEQYDLNARMFIQFAFLFIH